MSAFWIMAANSWMQTPVGGELINNRFILTDIFAAIWNPDAFWGITHMWLACLEISLFVIGGISAWYLWRGRYPDFFLTSFKMMVVAALIITPLQIVVGDGAGKSVHVHQPVKLAAMEAHWQTNPDGEGARLEYPCLARQKATGQCLVGQPALCPQSYHHHFPDWQGRRPAEVPVEDQPPFLLTFYAFRIMLVIGGALVLLMLWSLWLWRKGQLTAERVGRHKWMLLGWMAAIPLSYLSMEAGWVVREVGRQPWVIQGVLRTERGGESAAGRDGGRFVAWLCGYLFGLVSNLYFFCHTNTQKRA